MEKENEIPILLERIMWGWALKEWLFKIKIFRIMILKDGVEYVKMF